MNNLFNATKRESAVDIVVNSIKQLLLDRRLLPGDRLPSELEISEGLGVSRGSVREAMKILSAFGLVDIRVGNGTYVNTAPGDGLLDSLLFSFFITNPDVSNLYEFRRIFETDIVELVIAHYEDNWEQRHQLRENLTHLKQSIERKVSSEEILAIDLEFHRILGEACCNPLAAKVYAFILDSLKSSISNTLKHQKGEYVLQAHTQIYEIIEKKAIDKISEAVKNSVDIWYDLQPHEDDLI